MIGGGGTGGHIFPALAIAHEIKSRQPDAEILFVGAVGRMEMTRVPEAGYQIVGLPIAGLQRRLTVENFSLPLKVLRSVQRAMSLVSDFQPDVAIGVGGYASAPLLIAAGLKGIPYLIQEQNSYAGVTNKLLARSAKSICVAFPDMDEYFPKKKIQLTGNPVRPDLLNNNLSQYEGAAEFGLKPGVKTILVVGGSLGAKTVNESVAKALNDWKKNGFQLIWQTGKTYAEKASLLLKEAQYQGFITMPFIQKMNYAYAAADVVVSRAGALSLAEICITGKASILIPSPNVAEDHQTKNAQTLVQQNAALMIPDADARQKLGPLATQLLNDPNGIETLGMAAYTLARPEATKNIVNQVIRIATA